MTPTPRHPTQSRIYIRRAKRVARLIKAYLPHRPRPKDDPTVSRREYKGLVHWFLDTSVDEGPRRRRDRTVTDPVSGT